jgi:hypothetical protein
MQRRSVVYLTALLVGRGNQVSVAVWAACDRLVRVGTPAAGAFSQDAVAAGAGRAARGSPADC